MDGSVQTSDLVGEALYLKPGAKIEPLVDNWYAWTHALCPVQQALNLTYRYLPAVRSFVAAPSVHAAAVGDPQMYGGPFLDLPPACVPELRDYLKRVETDRAEALQFAQDIRVFGRDLVSSADGYSLNSLRQNLPESLRGRVELTYDLQNQPRLRVLEEMFIDDDLGLAQAQALFIHDAPAEARPFFLSTPRTASSDGVLVSVPIASEASQWLCGARHTPVPIDFLRVRLGLKPSDIDRYFTPRPPEMRHEPVECGVRIRYFGHASVLVESEDLSIMIDPTFALERHGPGHLTFEDLPPHIDFVLISHGHQDHLSTESLLALRSRVKTFIVPRNNCGEIADPSLATLLKSIGIDNVVEANTLDQVEFEGGAITLFPFSGEHSDLDVAAKTCYLVEIGGRRIAFFIDSDAIDIDIYRRLAGRLQNIDVLFVGMECFGAPLSWLYGPLSNAQTSKRNDDSRRLSGANCSQARALIDLLMPGSAYVYAMGQEIWMRHLMGLNYKEDSVQLRESADFVAYCRGLGMESERLRNVKEIRLDAK